MWDSSLHAPPGVPLGECQEARFTYTFFLSWVSYCATFFFEPSGLSAPPQNGDGSSPSACSLLLQLCMHHNSKTIASERGKPEQHQQLVGQQLHRRRWDQSLPGRDDLPAALQILAPHPPCRYRLLSPSQELRISTFFFQKHSATTT